MTFVTAERFGDRIIMVADTKISLDEGRGISRPGDPASRAHNFFPGRLKIFPLSTKISVGYAGFSTFALDCIRKIVRDFDTNSDLSGILEALRNCSQEDRAEFLIVSHVCGPEIYKITKGNVSDCQDRHWIGESSVAKLFGDSIKLSTDDENLSTSFRNMAFALGAMEGELHFTNGWNNLLLKNPTLTECVGGIPIVLVGSPYGHCFSGGAAVYCPDKIMICADGVGRSEDGRVVDHRFQCYGYSLIPSELRGAAILSLWLEDFRSGYIYDPLASDEPCNYSSCDHDLLRKKVSERALELGGKPEE